MSDTPKPDEVQYSSVYLLRPPDGAAAGSNRRLGFASLTGAVPAYLRRGPWWIVTASLSGLVLAIVTAGFVGLAFNHTVHETTQGALAYDVALQDDADDLRVAILDVRHNHRNLKFDGITNDGLIDYQDVYAELLDEIDEIEAMGIREERLPQPGELRQMATDYYALFWPALEAYETDPSAFEAGYSTGLVQLAALERLANQIDRYAERQADVAVSRIEQASSSARLVQIIVICGLVLIGAALIFAAIRVIDEVRRLYESEQAASKRLGEALRAKSNFVADISHELRTPLTVVRGNAEAGLAIDSNCEHREVLEDIVDESAKMTRLVEDLLFLARSDADAPPLELEPLSVRPLLRRVANRAEVLVRQRGATLATELRTDGTIKVDSARLEQAILALVDNAAKFSPAGETVQLSSTIHKQSLIIEVADKGPGIPGEDLRLIFERFYRTDKARSRRGGGAGLGLSIARTIVEAHGGVIEARSRLGSGTQMRIHLPLVALSTPAPPASIVTTTRELIVGDPTPLRPSPRLLARRRQVNPRNRIRSAADAAESTFPVGAGSNGRT